MTPDDAELLRILVAEESFVEVPSDDVIAAVEAWRRERGDEGPPLTVRTFHHCWAPRVATDSVDLRLWVATASPCYLVSELATSNILSIGDDFHEALRVFADAARVVQEERDNAEYGVVDDPPTFP